MNLTFPSAEFDQIVAAACHGSVTEEQARALNGLLRSHPDARDEYILRRLLEHNPGPLPDEDLVRVMREIISTSRN